jgi:ELWxxDGT repeat protein
MADDGTHGLELWSTDGIEANTRILKDIEPGVGTGLNFFLGGFRVGNKFLFTANNSATGIELWETDGTEAGTKLFKDIVPGPEGSTALVIPTATYNINTNTVSYPFFQGNKFFLVATTPQLGMELWISDGTEQGTTMVKDINPDAEDGVTLSSFVYTSTAFFFAATDGVHGEELWKSDGTANGTTMVANINTMPGEDGADADSEVALAPFIINNKVVFSATDDEQSPSDLYVVEGSFNALPVKLGDFIVTPKNADALLEWSTLSEVNTKDFTVQRSEDGIKFTPVGTVAAAGSSSTERRYQFIDKGIINSGKTIVYYKLAMNDKDGHSENTKVIPLKLKGTAELTVKLLGNPVQSQIVLMMSGNTNATVSVKDMSGKTFNTRTVRANGQISVPASNLAPGMYMIVVETDNSRKVVKFMKK